MIAIKMEHQTLLEKALMVGGRLHAFRSGAGLRVVRVDHGRLVAYGEHPHLSQALRIAAEDFESGGRPYDVVYGRMEEKYLTGSSEAEDELDAWILGGHTFDAWFEEPYFLVALCGIEMVNTPDDAMALVLSKGYTVEWSDHRGVRFKSMPTQLPNGERACSTGLVSLPENVKRERVWSYEATRAGEALRLLTAIDQALRAEKMTSV